MAKKLDQLQAIAKTAAEAKHNYETQLANAETTLEALSAEMTAATESGDAVKYASMKAKLAEAQKTVDELQELVNVANRGSGVPLADVIASWNDIRPDLNAKNEKARAAFLKSLDAAFKSYMDFAKSVNATYKTRDAYTALLPNNGKNSAILEELKAPLDGNFDHKSINRLFTGYPMLEAAEAVLSLYIYSAELDA